MRTAFLPCGGRLARMCATRAGGLLRCDIHGVATNVVAPVVVAVDVYASVDVDVNVKINVNASAVVDVNAAGIGTSPVVVGRSGNAGSSAALLGGVLRLGW